MMDLARYYLKYMLLIALCMLAGAVMFYYLNSEGILEGVVLEFATVFFG